jgi:hypothetical protein
MMTLAPVDPAQLAQRVLKLLCTGAHRAEYADPDLRLLRFGGERRREEADGMVRTTASPISRMSTSVEDGWRGV